MKPFTLVNAYDSHVHWLETGMRDRRLSLESLTSFSDIAKLKVESRHYRGDWLLAWGWDQSKYKEDYPTCQMLDQVFGPKTPCCFFRADGHALWASTEALKRSGVFEKGGDTLGGKTLRDDSGLPTGVLIDHAMDLVVAKVPALKPSDVDDALLAGMDIFLKAGFTHIRDLSCDSAQWDAAMRLLQKGSLTIAVEQFFDVVKPSYFDAALDLALRARKEKADLIRIKGIKVYYDGALGSEGALLSQPYAHNHAGHGLSLLTPDELDAIVRRTWEQGLEIAVHSIGDRALEEIVTVVCKLWDLGMTGKLHLEHVEMARSESLQRLAKRNIQCHLQPCHWLTDRRWLKEKLGPLFSTVFPWRKLEDLSIPFDFGSDSPIEKSSLLATHEALKDAANTGIPMIRKNWLRYHSHPDLNWTKDTETCWDSTRFSVKFLGKVII